MTNKIPFRDIKDHADLMDAFVRLMRIIGQTEMYSWNNDDEITYLKAEIAHFLRIQSAQEGIAVEGVDAFDKSGGYTKGTKL